MSVVLLLGPLFWILNSSDGVYGVAVTATVPVGVELTPPQNVTVISLNTNYTLIWDWNQSPGKTYDVTFTVQFVGSYELTDKKRDPEWVSVCERVSGRSCDLTGLDLHYLGMYVFHVRTDWNGHHSEWVQVEFCPERDADLGPPVKVELRPAGNLLDVTISEPRSSQDTVMKEHLSKLYYRIKYWEQSQDGKASEKHLNTTATFVTLPGLKAWTRYCVSVQSREDGEHRKSSIFSHPHCLETEGHLSWWQIVLYFLSALLVFLLLVLLLIWCFFYSCVTLKSIWFPSSQLPTHLEQFLRHSPRSHPPRLLTPHSELELLCDKVTICALPEVLVNQTHPCGTLMGLELNNRHSRHGSGSSSSEDSGVYSAGGSSSQPSIKHQAQPLAMTFDSGPRKDTSHDVWTRALTAEGH
ncbi:interferon alpha/beta receptor 1b-like isoform X2 [Cynoglossus semilaevis]|uniref:interferon alpha/beta receptor 1b-like isoform X2 n=1 Tax=Cynoglossus semilaevis TaxID=244447 RepID=UPI0007DC9BCD|nr:interferon alpha/beta receptor 1b-like isoform X2 [Cynoglossus semilaevis]